MSKQEEESLSCAPNFISPPPKGDKCDICGKHGPIRWWGHTSVAVCADPKCSKKMAANWERTKREIDDEERVKHESNY